MKNRVTKLLLLVLSLALLVGGAVGISVSAENAAPEIISKNVMDTGDFCLMFAVDPATVAGEDVTLRVYDRDPSDADKKLAFEETKAVTATEDIDLDGDRTPETAVIVFTTAGVSAKDFADVWYIETESAGAKKVITYSVMEYAFERLYRDGAVLASDKDADLYSYYQKEFYLGMLNMGSAAQNLHVNYGKAEAERERLVKEYTYVSVLDGTFTAGEATADRGFVEANTSITLNANDTEAIKGWSVITYGQEGKQTDRKVANDGDTITVTGNTVVIPYEIGVTAGKYFDEIGDDWYAFETATNSELFSSSAGRASYYGYSTNINDTNKGYIGFISDTDNSHGKVMHIAKDASDAVPATLHFAISSASASANVIVFETDIKLVSTGNTTFDSGEIKTSEAVFQSALTLHWITNTVSQASNTTSTTKALISYISSVDSDKTLTDSIGGDSLREQHTDNAYDMKVGEWHNICYEIYTDVNKAVFYMDGVAVATWDISSIDISTINAMSIRSENRFKGYDIYLDDFCCTKTAKEYKAQVIEK